MELVLILISSLIAPGLLLVLKKKVDATDRKVEETNKQLTVNSFKSEPNTVLDLLHMIREDQKATNHKLDNHIQWHLDREH